MRKLAFYIIGLVLLGAPLTVSAAGFPKAEVENLRYFYEGTGIVVPDAKDVVFDETARGFFDEISSISNAIACNVLVRDGSRDSSGICKDWLK